MKRIILASVVATLFVPFVASASFADKSATAKQATAAMSSQQLDGLDVKPFYEAHLTARIIGFDRAEFDALKAEVQELKAENQRLRSSLAQNVGSAAVTDADVPSLDARVTKLEGMFAGLQDSLVLLLNLVSEALNLVR